MDRKIYKISFFAVLYFVQGAVFAYVVNFQKPYLAGIGISKDALGLFTSLLMIPFVLKVVLGAVSDRIPLGRFGPRKPYMLFGLGLFAISYALVSQINPQTDFFTFAALSWAASLGLAWFDTCADGWAVDVAQEHEEVFIQAAMGVGRSTGLIVMSLVFGSMVEVFGYSSVFVLLSALGVAVGFIVLLSPYRPAQISKTKTKGQISALLSKSYLYFAVFGVLYSVASFGTDGLMTLYLSERDGLSSAQLGVFGTFRGLGAVAGAGFAVWVSSRWPLQRLLVGALVILGSGCLVPLSHLPVILGAGLWGFAWGLQETAFVTLAMVFSRGAWAATFFAAAMIFSNLGTSIGEAVAAPVAGRLGYEFVFIGFALLAWGTTLIVPRLTKS